MKKAKHTPGPWHTQRGAIVGQGDLIAVCGEASALPTQTDLANARLIAAAPDLFASAEALWNAADELDLSTTPNEWHALRKAIGKARGE